MVSYMVGKLAPSSTHSTRVLVKYVPGYGVSSCRLLPKRGQSCYVPAPPPIFKRVDTYNGPPTLSGTPWRLRVGLHGPPWRPPRSSMKLHGDLHGPPWRPPLELHRARWRSSWSARKYRTPPIILYFNFLR